MRLIAGVDGGNTKTVALVCDLDGRVRGLGLVGSSSPEDMGFESAAAAVTEVIEQALAVASATRDEIICIHIGLAGIDWPEDGAGMREALAAAGWKCEMTLENDAFLALRGTAPDGCGIGVTVGSGTACGIIRPDGEKYFYGAFTDLGGGREIDAHTLHAVVRSEDGRGPATKLTEALLQATRHARVVDLLYAIHREQRHLPHGILRRVLFSTAAQGDPVAVRIVARFAEEMALCATNLVHRYHLEEEAVPVVAAGALFQKTGPLMFDSFRESVLKGTPKARPILTEQPPVMGAVRGALRAMGRDDPERWQQISQRAAKEEWLQKAAGAGTEEGGNEEQ